MCQVFLNQYMKGDVKTAENKLKKLIKEKPTDDGIYSLLDDELQK